jgi:hypothetical protein
MGQAKLKRRAAFASPLVAEWESEDCVNFAIALARETGWLLHVDWWVPTADPDLEVPLDKFKPLRVYVGDNHDRIFDVRGIRSISDFIHRTIRDLAIRQGNGGVRTRFYAEEKLKALPLKIQPDENKIVRATEAIRANADYLANITPRPAGAIPSHLAAPFAYGRCALFAEALHEVTGCDSVALLAVRFAAMFEGTRRDASGYVHSVVLHGAGIAEDCWGKAPLAEIAGRFGVVEFRTSRAEQERVVESLRNNSPELYDPILQDARELIRQYRAL